MGRLEYDSRAFSFFFLSLCLAVLVPLSYTWIRFAWEAFKVPPVQQQQEDKQQQSETNVFVARLATRKLAKRVEARAMGVSLAIKRLGILALAWAVVLTYVGVRDTGSNINKFDPFEILGISESASELEIKKAYKKLSLVHHPDRWQNKDKTERALAETKFIMVAKAYEALTDPISRENFQKYGNPDGRQALEMSIGLPAWLLEKDNQTFVIASYLLLIIVVFPTSVMLLTSSAQKSGGTTPASASSTGSSSSSAAADARRLFPDTEEIFRVGIRFGITWQALIELFALAAEFRVLHYRSEDERKRLLEIRNDMVRVDRFPARALPGVVQIKKLLPKQYEGNEKALVLVWIHVNRWHDRLSEELMDDLELILLRSPVILRALVNHARVLCFTGSLTHAILVGQMINQAVTPTDYSQFLQLSASGKPIFTQEEAEFANVSVGMHRSKLKETKADDTAKLTNVAWVYETMRTKGKKAIPALFSGEDAERKQKALEQALVRLPFRKLASKVGTLREQTHKGKSKKPRDTEYVFEDEIRQGDQVHAVLRLEARDRSACASEPKDRIATTPFLPHDVKEEWFLIMMGGVPPKGFVNIPTKFEKVSGFYTLDEDSMAELVGDIVFLTVNNQNDWMGSCDWPLGQNKVRFLALHSVYTGLDLVGEVTFDVKDASAVPKFKYHREDVAIENEPTSLLQMLQPQVEAEVDSDFGGDDDDGENDDGNDGDEDEDEGGHAHTTQDEGELAVDAD